jgi:hypothetical protein
MTSAFLATIETLANKIAREALDSKNTLETRIDAFKALAPYYGLLLKQQAKSEDEPGGPTFGELGAGFNGGRAQVRDR